MWDGIQNNRLPSITIIYYVIWTVLVFKNTFIIFFLTSFQLKGKAILYDYYVRLMYLLQVCMYLL